MMIKSLLFLFVPFILIAQAPKTTPVRQAKSTISAVTVSEDGEGWLKNYDEAVVDANKEDRNILVYFTGSDWCPPCKMLKKDLFETSNFATLSKNYTLLYIDIPRNRTLLSKEQMQHNSKLLHKINKKGVFPLIVILNVKGSEIDQLSGYGMNGEIQAHLDLLEKHKD